MRAALPERKIPDHPGLAYEVWAPFGDDGKIPDEDRPKWLEAVARREPPADYGTAFARWRASFAQPGDLVVEVEAASRLLVGHGNPSATDVGLTLHRTWGVPVIPGSALKGLLAHWMEATFGPEPGEDEPERLPFVGVAWEGRRIRNGPGAVHRALFGAPEAEEALDGRPKEAQRGLVFVHDALWVPDTPEPGSPLALDVLTVHQKGYYDTAGGHSANDWEGPNPVTFLSVRPGARFLVALSGPADWTAFARDRLLEALAEWGVGGKTSSGYGRLVVAPARSTTARASVEKPTEAASSEPGPVEPREGEELDCVLVEVLKSGQWRARHEPSGLQGPVLNSKMLPTGVAAGATVRLRLAKAKGKDSRFEVP